MFRWGQAGEEGRCGFMSLSFLCTRYQWLKAGRGVKSFRRRSCIPLALDEPKVRLSHDRKLALPTKERPINLKSEMD